MKPLPRIEGEVQRYQIGPDGDEWVKADDYAALNDYAALVQMERDMARAEVERLKPLRGDLQTVSDVLRDFPGETAWQQAQAAVAEVERWRAARTSSSVRDVRP